jgi:transcriptional regulator with XRE-family HTH domain
VKLPDNPHPYAVLRKELNVSQTHLARVAGIGPQVIMRTEQGLFATPSPKLVQGLISEASQVGQELNSTVLQQAHQDWITRERVRNGVLLQWGVDNWNNSFYDKLFREYFGGYGQSVVGFCKLVCVQLSIVQRWNFKGAMPPILYDAFREAGVDLDSLQRANRALRECS